VLPSHPPTAPPHAHLQGWSRHLGLGRPYTPAPLYRARAASCPFLSHLMTGTCLPPATPAHGLACCAHPVAAAPCYYAWNNLPARRHLSRGGQPHNARRPALRTLHSRAALSLPARLPPLAAPRRMPSPALEARGKNWRAAHRQLFCCWPYYALLSLAAPRQTTLDLQARLSRRPTSGAGGWRSIDSKAGHATKRTARRTQKIFS